MSRVAQYLRLHHHHGASDPDAPHPPMGGSRNEAIGLILVLLILTLIAAAFFWQSARKGSVQGPSAGVGDGDDTALRLGDDVVSPPAGSFAGVRDSWSQTDLQAVRERPVERLALVVLARDGRAM